MKYRLPYEPALDGLRGLSVMAVMVFHAVPLALPGGFLGVDIFFALSGYLITRLLLLEYEATERIDLLRFYTRRWFRLGPALLAMLFFYGLTLWLFSPDATLNNQGTDILLAMLYLTNWARALLMKESVDLGHTWSLAVEEQFYIVWPLLLWALMRFVKGRLALFTIIVSLAGLSWAVRQFLFLDGASVHRIYNGLDTRLETIMWGAALAAWISNKSSHDHYRYGNIGITALSAICFTYLLILFKGAEWTSDWYYQWGISLVAILSIILIGYLHAVEHSVIKSVLSQHGLVWLGTVSYGLYLWHFPVYRLLLSFDVKDGWLLVLGVLTTIPIAALSYYCLERPLLNLQSRKQT